MFDERLHTLSSQIAKMTPQQRQQFAAMHRDDPILVGLAKFVNDRERAVATAMSAQQAGAQGDPPKVVDQEIAAMVPQSPQAPAQATSSGIAALPAPALQGMADGGIVGYDEGDEGAGYAEGGDVKTKFAKEYGELAARAGAEIGVSPHIVLAQWGLETGWGKSVIPGTNNLGNVKRGSSKGKAVRAHDKAEGSNDEYRAYDNPKEFAADWVKMVKTNFPGAVGAGGDAQKFAQGLQSGRYGAYATDPNYAQKVAGAAGSSTAATGSDPARAEHDRREAQITQIPGMGPKRSYEEAQPKPEPESSLLDTLKGTAKTAGAVLYNTAAMPAAGLMALAKRATGNKDATLDTEFKNIAYSPDDVVSQRQLQTINETLDAAKVPAYMPAMGGTRGAAVGALGKKAATAEAKAAAPRLGAPEVAGPMPAGASAAERAAQAVANQKADEAAAQAARLRAEQGNAGLPSLKAANQYVGEAGARANRVGRNAVATQAMPEPDPASRAPSLVPNEASYAADYRNGSDMNSDANAVERQDYVAPTDVMGGPEGARQDRGPGRFDNDDLLSFGLNLMAGKNPRLMGSIGEAGIATLKGKREREKDATSAEYMKAMTNQANAVADDKKAGMKPMAQAQKRADQLYDNWLAGIKDNAEFMTMPQKDKDRMLAQKQQQFLRQAMGELKIAEPAQSADALSGKIDPARYSAVTSFFDSKT